MLFFSLPALALLTGCFFDRWAGAEHETLVGD